MKKIISLVVTLSLVITMFASVTAFATAEEIWSKDSNPTSIGYIAYSSEYPDETAYLVHELTISSETAIVRTEFNIFKTYTINDVDGLDSGDNRLTIVYNMADKDAYYFVNGFLKGVALNSDGKLTSPNHSMSAYTRYATWQDCDKATVTIKSFSQKAYGSDFKFKDFGLYGGYATYDKSTKKYTVGNKIGRIRLAGAAKINSKNDCIGALASNADKTDASASEGVAIAGYDENGAMEFVSFMGYSTASYGVGASKVSEVTDEVDNLKLFVFDEWNYGKNSLSPAIRALDVKIQ